MIVHIKYLRFFFLGTEGCTLINYPRIFEMDLWRIYTSYGNLKNISMTYIYVIRAWKGYECGHSLNKVINNLETTTEKVFEWFSFNNLKGNTSKCHLFVSPYEPVSLSVRGSIIESSCCEKLLGIFIGSNFTFEYHISRICRKTNQKLHALSRISKYNSGDLL